MLAAFQTGAVGVIASSSARRLGKGPRQFSKYGVASMPAFAGRARARAMNSGRQAFLPCWR